MTALGTMLQSNAAHIFADGSVTNPDGSTGKPATKLWPLPIANSVIGVSGPFFASPIVAFQFGAIGRSFEELKANAESALREVVAVLTKMWAVPPLDQRIDVVCVGWSKRGADSFLICNHDDYGYEPFTPVDPRESLITPIDAAMHFAVCAGLPAGYRSPDDLDVEQHACRLGELWRSHPWDGVTIGEHLQLASVFPDGSIVTKIVTRW